MRHLFLLMCAGVVLPGCEGSILGGQTSAEVELWPAHLLTATEYNTTIQDLLGTTSRPADYFPATSATEFDANVGVLQDLSPVQGEAVFNAARALAEETLASPELRARLVTCTPSAGDDDACVRSLITSLGRRVYRRPLDPEENEALLETYQHARDTLALEHPEAVGHVLRVMLSSPSFFLRIERPGTGPSPLEPAALASRLSYLLWGSMPDDQLLDDAEAGALGDPQALMATADRMLDDPRGQRFVSRFLGQWLGTVRLPSHNVDAALFPMWNAQVATAVETQANTFFSSFVTGSTPWSELFTAPHPAQAALQPLLAADPTNQPRRGFLTLPAFLTLSSHSDRTSPTARAKGIVTALFCTNMAPPPGVTTDLPPETGTPRTLRERLEAHRRNPSCASCHDILDPLGLSLENFDAVGRYRTHDEGQPIDATGTYRGTAFTNVSELVPLVASDPRLGSCAPRKLYAFALRRSLASGDEAQLQKLVDGWQAGTFRSLVHEVVVAPAFRGQTQETP